MNKALRFWNTIYIFHFIDISTSVPPLYCHEQINTSDCGGTPTPVFSFYKPGSRCEIEIWRGCATLNKFDDEYQCVHTCMFSFLKSSEEASVELLMYNESNCDKDLNTTKCTDEIVPVYTFERKNKKCLRVDWKGCSTDNKFPDKKSCIANCMPKANNTNFVEKLSHLVSKDANNINSVLNKILKHELEELNLTTEFVTEETTVDSTSLTNLVDTDEISNENITTTVQETITDTVLETTSKITTLKTTFSTTELIASAATESSTILTTIPTTIAATEAPTTQITTETTSTTSEPTTAPTSTSTSATTSAPTSASTTAPTTTTITTPTITTTTTSTTIPPSGTVEEVVVPGDDDYDDN